MRWINLLAGVVLSLYFATTASAVVTKTVDCSKGKSINEAVAKLDAAEDYVVEVIGTCNENVVIRNFEGNSLTISGTPAATINGQNATPIAPAVLVSTSKNVFLANLTVNVAPGTTPTTGNTHGILYSQCRACSLNEVTVNADRAGMLTAGSQGLIQNLTVNMTGVGTGLIVTNSSDYTLLNFGATGVTTPFLSASGLHSDGSSRVRLAYTTAKQIRNFNAGIRATNSSSVEGGGLCGPSVCLELVDYTAGIRITSSRGTVMSGINLNANGDGIVVEAGSTATLGPVLSVTGSTGGTLGGNGIVATHNSHVSIQAASAPTAPNTISGNARRGITLGSGSTLMLAGPGIGTLQNVFTGNSVADIACDTLSSVTGTSTLAAGAVVSCVNSNAAVTPLP